MHARRKNYFLPIFITLLQLFSVFYPLISTSFAAGTVDLVKDIQPGSNGGIDSIVTMGGYTYFKAYNEQYGWELWKTNGTESGTSLVKDINPGSVGSDISSLTAIDNKLYFSAYRVPQEDISLDSTKSARYVKMKGIHRKYEWGYSIWEFNIYNTNVSNTNLALNKPAVASATYDADPSWSANNVTDGDSNTRWAAPYEDDHWIYVDLQSVQNFNKISIKWETAYAKDYEIQISNDATNWTTVYTVTNGNGGQTGRELWVSDGTENGTYMVKDINPGYEPSYPEEFTKAGGKVFFRSYTNDNGWELWTTDGTEEGTHIVKDILPEFNYSSYPYDLTEYNGKLYFTANAGGSYYQQMFVSDGTSDGTHMVKYTPGYFSPVYYFKFDDKLFFSQYSDDTGNELWKTDGTEEGTSMVIDGIPGNWGWNPNSFFEFNNKLYFSCSTQSNGNELCYSDGTEGGSGVAIDIEPGVGSSNAYYLGKSNDFVLLSAYKAGTGTELYKFDGENVTLVRDIYQGNYGSSIEEFIKLGNQFYFEAYRPLTGYELWQTDGTKKGTKLVKDIYSGSYSDGDLNAYIGFINTYNNSLVFGAQDGVSGTELRIYTPGDLYESYDTPVTPNNPGTPINKENTLTEDGKYAITGMSETENGYDSQVFKISPNLNGNTNPQFTIKWVGHGDVNSKKVYLYVYNFATSAWEELTNDVCPGTPGDCTLTSKVKGTKYLDNDNKLWVWGKAENSYGAPVLSNIQGIFQHIIWDTNIESNSEIAWSESPKSNWEDYENTLVINPTQTEHMVYVDSLTPGVTYYFRVKSANKDGVYSQVSDEYSFTAQYLSSSCPFVFSNDGNKYNFVTDVSSSGSLGRGLRKELWAAKPFYRNPNTVNPFPVGYVAIDSDKIKPITKDGETYYDLKVTTELNETNYFDELSLLTIDHSKSVNAYPDYRNNGVIHTISTKPDSVVWAKDKISKDVTDLVSKEDGNFWLGDFSSEPSMITFKLVNTDTTPANLKFLIKRGKDGNVSGTSDDRLQYKNDEGNFVDVPTSYDIFKVARPGYASGRVSNLVNTFGTETKVIDLSGLQIKDNEIRILSNNNTRRWAIDYVAIDTNPNENVIINTLKPYYANLDYRGVSKQEQIDTTNADLKITVPNYSDLTTTTSKGYALTGKATRYGDVKELFENKDNKFVVMVQGDEAALKFQVPEQQNDTARSFVFYSWDYHKTGRNALGDTITPLPFNSMTRYPYSAEEFYPTENQAYLDAFNTRDINWVIDPVTKNAKVVHNSMNTDLLEVTVGTGEPDSNGNSNNENNNSTPPKKTTSVKTEINKNKLETGKTKFASKVRFTNSDGKEIYYQWVSGWGNSKNDSNWKRYTSSFFIPKGKYTLYYKVGSIIKTVKFEGIGYETISNPSYNLDFKNKSVTLTWNIKNSEYISNIKVFRGTTSNFDASVNSQIAVLNGTQTSIRLSGINNFKEGFYKVVSYDKNNKALKTLVIKVSIK